MAKLKTSDLWALLLTVVVGGIFTYMFSTAFAEGEARRRETPLRALLGNDAYDALSSGEPSEQHYLGNDRRAPDFSLQTASGETWRLSDHRGKVVVINFWTVTCQPCIEEMPSLASLSEILVHRDDIELVTINADADWDTVHAVLPPNRALTVLLDADREVTENRFGTRLFPETWVIDPQGVIRLRIDGARDWSSPIATEVFEMFL